jgi:hypothetical protein
MGSNAPSAYTSAKTQNERSSGRRGYPELRVEGVKGVPGDVEERKTCCCKHPIYRRNEVVGITNDR